MSNLTNVFKNNKAFIPFVVACDPDFDTTVANIIALAEGGADIVELGIPFSDPVADGPVIQAADMRALTNKPDLTMDDVFDIVKKVRLTTAIPIVLLTYSNIIFQYGYAAFCKKCAALAIDGLVIPDMPLEEQTELKHFTDKANLALIPLITPTSGVRIAKIAQAASGFIYVVSSLGVTGLRANFDQNLADVIAQIKNVSAIPTAIGFGIHTATQAQTMAKFADGVIVGSACVQIVAKYQKMAPPYLKQYTQTMKQSIASTLDE